VSTNGKPKVAPRVEAEVRRILRKEAARILAERLAAENGKDDGRRGRGRFHVPAPDPPSPPAPRRTETAGSIWRDRA
jgi:hypothetical protein